MHIFYYEISEIFYWKAVKLNAFRQGHIFRIYYTYYYTTFAHHEKFKLWHLYFFAPAYCTCFYTEIVSLISERKSGTSKPYFYEIQLLKNVATIYNFLPTSFSVNISIHFKYTEALKEGQQVIRFTITRFHRYRENIFVDSFSLSEIVLLSFLYTVHKIDWNLFINRLRITLMCIKNLNI